MILSLAVLSGEENGKTRPDPEALTPSTATLFLRTPEMEKSLRLINYILKNMISKKDQGRISEGTEKLKASTGIDPLNPESLSGAGIDVRRPFSVAYLRGDKDAERIVLFIPVKDDNFSARFVTILRKYYRERPETDFNPVITRYKKYKLYRVMGDNYFTAMDGTFVLASSGKVLQRVVDLRLGEGAETPIATEAKYADFKAKMKEGCDINLYITRDFLKEVYEYRLKKQAERKTGEKKKKEADDDADAEDAPKAPKKEEKRRDEAPMDMLKNQSVPLNPSQFNSLDYLGFGMKSEGDDLVLKAAAAVNRDHPSARTLEALRPGLVAKTLFAEDVISYYFLSMDLKALEEPCTAAGNREDPLCGIHESLKKSLMNEMGLGLEEDLAPAFGGFFNLMVRRSDIKGKLDNFVIYFPAVDAGKGRALWKKTRKHFKNKTEEDGEFGEEKIDNIPSFWFRDRKGNKITYLVTENHFYIGNNVEFLRLAMTNRSRAAAGMKHEFMKRTGDPTFMVFYLKLEKDSFFKALLMLLTYNTNPSLYGLISRLDNISLIGEKIDNCLLFHAKFKIMPAVIRKMEKQGITLKDIL